MMEQTLSKPETVEQLDAKAGCPAPICSPLIECRFDSVSGSFDMRSGKLVAVKRPKYGSVTLCFAVGWNIPIAEIKLHDRNLARDADATFEAAGRLGDEICRRWNLHSENTTVEARRDAVASDECSPRANHQKPTEP